MQPPRAISLIGEGNQWRIATVGDIAIGSETFNYIRLDLLPKSVVEAIKQESEQGEVS